MTPQTKPKTAASLSALREVRDLIENDCLDCAALRAARLARGMTPVMRSDRRESCRALLWAMMPHLDVDEQTGEIVLACSAKRWAEDADLGMRTAYNVVEELDQIGWIRAEVTYDRQRQRFNPMRVVVTAELWRQLRVGRALLKRLLRANRYRRGQDPHIPRLVTEADVAAYRRRRSEPARVKLDHRPSVKKARACHTVPGPATAPQPNRRDQEIAADAQVRERMRLQLLQADPTFAALPRLEQFARASQMLSEKELQE